MLLFLKIKLIYSPCLVSVVHLAYFVVFEVFVAAIFIESYDKHLKKDEWTTETMSCRALEFSTRCVT